jgi:hypothetical protein
VDFGGLSGSLGIACGYKLVGGMNLHSKIFERGLVGRGRLELPTYSLGNCRSIQLSYRPSMGFYHARIVAEGGRVPRTVIICSFISGKGGDW